MANQGGRSAKNSLFSRIAHTVAVFFQRHIGKGTVLLLTFFLFNTVGTNLFLTKIIGYKINEKRVVQYYNTDSYYTFLLLSPPTRNTFWDSWLYLYNARCYLHKHPEKNIYTEFYFNRGMKFQYPPTCVLFAEPFKKITAREFIKMANTASWISVFISIFFLADIFSLSLRRFAPAKSNLFGGFPAKLLVAFCFATGFYPLISSYGLGQIQTFIYLLFTCAVWLWLRGKGIFPGIFIGLSSLIKPQFSLYLLWGLVRKNFKFVISWAVPVTVLGGISILAYGWHHHTEYIQFLYFISKHGESYYQNQSLNGLLYRLFRIGPNIYPSNHFYAPYNFWVHMGNYAALFLFVIPSLFFLRRGKEFYDEILDFSIAGLSFTMASPIAWIHHYSIMLPLYALVLPMALASGEKTYLWIFATSYFLCSNLLYVTNYFSESKANVIQSLTFLGAILFLALLYTLRFQARKRTPYLKSYVPAFSTDI